MSTLAITFDTSPSDYRKLSGDDRDWRTGEITPFDKYRERFIKRFWAKVDKTPGLGPWGNCWEWRGASDQRARVSYGNFGVSSNHALALGFKSSVNVQKSHVAAWIVIYGHEIPNGHEMCHKCNNKPCIREDHLFTGTHATNIRHAQATGVMRIAKPKPAPVEYRVYLSVTQQHMLRVARKRQRVALADVAFMAQMHITHLSLIERGKRSCRLNRLIFMLDFLKIDRDAFGLASCKLIPIWRHRQSTAAYLHKPPVYVYRQPAHDQFIERRAPRWYDKLGDVSNHDYDARALVEIFKQAGVKQGDLAADTGLKREIVREILRGRARDESQLMAVLRHAETVRNRPHSL